jgi:hypothetical protein
MLRSHHHLQMAEQTEWVRQSALVHAELGSTPDEQQQRTLQAPRLTEINTLPPSDRTVYFLNSYSRRFIYKIFMKL